MFAHVLDHCIFSAQWKEKTKRVGFGIVALLIVANFWWFRGLAWGVAGPINDHWGLQWRKVSSSTAITLGVLGLILFIELEYL